MTRCTPAGSILPALLVIVALSSARCGPTEPARASIFAVAIDGAPGGAFLSAWVEPGTAHRGWLVGGFVGVAPDTVPDGRVGRLVRYDHGELNTVCTTPRALWWVDVARDGHDEVVFAAGEGGTVIRYRAGRCETLSTEGLWAEGAPTFWGLRAYAANDVTLVGGSSGDGPRGVIVHWNGLRFTREDARLPPEARERNLYKLADGALGTFLVGEGGTLLQGEEDGHWRAVPVILRSTDNRLFTVSCDRVVPRCYAVGGAGAGLVLLGESTGWRTLADDGAPGLAGVWMQDANSTFLVGAQGFTMHTNNVTSYRPNVTETPAALHAVTGNASLVLAVGGELDTPDTSQRGVVLVRGAQEGHFRLDGRSYTATGRVRPTLGAGVGGAQ